MTKKLIITLCDGSTGEILGSNKNSRHIPVDMLRKSILPWLDSLLRGLEKRSELGLTISIRNDAPQNMDDLFVDYHVDENIVPVTDSINTPF